MSEYRSMSRPRPAHWLLAVVLPLVVFGGGLWCIASMAPPEANAAAGRMMNGKTVRGTIAEYIDKRMEADPEVLILGNSLANTDVQPGPLARELGVPVAMVERFSIPNTVGAHWYALLKHRVFGAGYRPRVVILLADLRSVLTPEPVSAESNLTLAELLTDEDEELAFQRGEGDRLGALMERRQSLRETLITGARNAVVDLGFFHRFPVASENHAQTASALARLLDGARVDIALHHAVVGRIVGNAETAASRSDENLTVEDSFLPRLIDLAKAHNTELIVVRPPFSDQVPSYLADVVPVAVEKQARSSLEEAGNHLFDLRQVYIPRGHFKDAVHLNEPGGRRMTHVIADLLRERQVIGPTMSDGVSLLDPIRRLTDTPTWVAPKLWAPTRIDVPSTPLTFEPHKKHIARATLSNLSWFSDTATMTRTPYVSRCSLARVLEDGVPLRFPNAACEDVVVAGTGRYCHLPDRILFTASDGTAPWENGREYVVKLDSDPACEGAAWLIPGQELVLDVDPGLTSVDPGPWDVMWVEVVPMIRGARGLDPITVTLERDGQEIARGTITMEEAVRDLSELRFSPALTRLPTRVRVTGPPRGYLLLTNLVLTREGVERRRRRLARLLDSEEGEAVSDPALDDEEPERLEGEQ